MKERLGDLDLSKNKIERLEWIFNFFLFILFVTTTKKENCLAKYCLEREKFMKFDILFNERMYSTLVLYLILIFDKARGI